MLYARKNTHIYVHPYAGLIIMYLRMEIVTIFYVEHMARNGG